MTSAIRIFIVSDATENWSLELAAGATRPDMKQDTIAKDATRNCGVEGGWLMKYCMDCRFFKGKLTVARKRLLDDMLQRYGAETILKSWVQQGHIRKYAGRGVNAEKAEVVRVIADAKGFCRHERVAVSPVDQACAFWQPRECTP